MKVPSMIWLKNGRELSQVEDSIQVIEELPKKIYTLQKKPLSGDLYLEEFADEFSFNFKLYGIETRFIEHVLKTFESTNTNLGVLLNGVKGTGKTITAKILANKMNLPVILVNGYYEGLAEFIAKIESDCILFFDEYEKRFDKERMTDTDILAIMDGVFNSPHRRVFLLTTNSLYINDNMIGRPSRIRYKKTFSNLPPEIVKEYLDDNLINKEYTQSIISYIDTLAISTIDILKAVVDEFNIHNTPLSEWKNFFNTEPARYTWSCYVYKQDSDEEFSKEEFKEKLNMLGTLYKTSEGKDDIYGLDDLDLWCSTVRTNESIFSLRVGEDFGQYGTIVEVLLDEGMVITTDDYNSTYYAKILNLETKPSLYRGGLVF
jgi:hypothetical protein